MDKKKLTLELVSALEKIYPEAKCSLIYTEPYELLIAARLSAQCTDERVNKVTEKLFKKYPSLYSFASADLNELESDVKSCGFYKNKARSIKAMSIRILEEYGGRLPDNIEDLLTLPGIGRKTANLIMGDIWGKPAIVTDTHFIRITRRVGLTVNKAPHKVEEDLRKLIPPEKSSDFCHRIVQFGRDICRARNPGCDNCIMAGKCAWH